MRIYTTYVQSGLALRCSNCSYKSPKSKSPTRLYAAQFGLCICYYHTPNTDGAELSMLSLTSSIFCTTLRETERVVSQQIVLKNTQDVNQFAHQRSSTNNNPDRTIFACVLYSIQCKNAIGQLEFGAALKF